MPDARRRGLRNVDFTVCLVKVVCERVFRALRVRWPELLGLAEIHFNLASLGDDHAPPDGEVWSLLNRL
jgi:hypothetical protein